MNLEMNESLVTILHDVKRSLFAFEVLLNADWEVRQRRCDDKKNNVELAWAYP
jgi:hypothetical protein